MIAASLQALGLSPVALVDVVIAVTLAEAAVLLALRGRGRTPPPSRWLPNVVSGLCLMAALRATLTGAGLGWLVAGLVGAGVAHAVDAAGWWRRR